MAVTRRDWHPSQFIENVISLPALCKAILLLPVQIWGNSDVPLDASFDTVTATCTECHADYILWVVTGARAGGNVDGCRASGSAACHYTQECAHCSHHRTPNYFNSILCRSFGVFSWLVNSFLWSVCAFHTFLATNIAVSCCQPFLLAV